MDLRQFARLNETQIILAIVSLLNSEFGLKIIKSFKKHVHHFALETQRPIWKSESQDFTVRVREMLPLEMMLTCF